MALSPAFLDELRARTPMQPLVARRVKLRRAGRNWTGCCPFHAEKSPSFTVYEDGFHCFGCGAHGDAIGFVMQTEGLGFTDAVERLAAEAGLEVPRPSRAERAQEAAAEGLHAVLAAAAAEFQRLLCAPEGAEALAYLRGRGLDDAAIAKFGLGWSGAGRGSLIAALRPRGITPAQMEEAGLLRPPAAGGPARELYWERVIFPIRDRRGRVISFGGRALGDAKPKYINGPETALFHKGRTLYGLDVAQAAVRRGARLLVCEGYMDVIALQRAGFEGAVAPLGTALGPEQMELLWRLHPVPLLCFDGDAAGARAASRAAAVALPLLGAARSLEFVALPAGQDPDALLRREGGRAEFEAALEARRPMADMLYATLAEGVGPTPEARAALRARLDEAAASIRDRVLAAEYRSALRDRFFRAARARFAGSPAARPGPRPRQAPDPDAAQAERARCLTAILLRHPALLHDVEQAYAGLDLPDWLDRLRRAILAAEGEGPLDSAALLDHLHASGLGQEAARALSSALPLPGGARAEAMPAEAEAEWWHLFGLMRGLSRLDREVAEAARAYQEAPSGQAERRLVGLAHARLELIEPDHDA